MTTVQHYDWIAHHAMRTPQRIAVIDLATDRRFTYREFDDCIARLAWHLRAEFDLARGQRIAVLAQNTTDMVEIQSACGRLGLILVPLNWRLSIVELEAIIADCTPTMLIYDRGFAEQTANLSRACSIQHLCMRGGADAPYEAAIKNARKLEEPVTTNPR